MLTVGVAPSYGQDTADDDATLRVAEPDFVLINLPTNMPLPVNRTNFHLTHRFNLNLRQTDFSDQVQNLFGLDNGANIGLEFRYGVARHLQAVVQRTSIGKVIQFSAKYDGLHQTESRHYGLSFVASVEGDDNFKGSHAPALGVVASGTVADWLAVYVTPMWVHNTSTAVTPEGNTGLLGLGARVRLLEATYLIGEVAPRVGGFAIGDPEYGFAIEKRVGAHVFSLTFTNGASTTFRQLARGGVPGALYLGFNLTRKFF